MPVDSQGKGQRGLSQAVGHTVAAEVGHLVREEAAVGLAEEAAGDTKAEVVEAGMTVGAVVADMNEVDVAEAGEATIQMGSEDVVKEEEEVATEDLKITG